MRIWSASSFAIPGSRSGVALAVALPLGQTKSRQTTGFDFVEGERNFLPHRYAAEPCHDREVVHRRNCGRDQKSRFEIRRFWLGN
jgi:hypothetical protein